MNMSGKKTGEVAEHLGISSQALSNKLYRSSFTAEDLIKIAASLGCKLAFVSEDTDEQKITLDLSDIRDEEQTAQD